MVDIRGSESFTARTREAIDILPEEYLGLVKCWLNAIVEGSSPAGATGVANVESGTYYEMDNVFPYTPDVARVAYAASMVHEAVHVREYWHGRPFEGRDGELTALRAQLEVTRAFPVPFELLGCLAELINHIDDPAYQYWNGANPPCEAAWRGPATPTPT